MKLLSPSMAFVSRGVSDPAPQVVGSTKYTYADFTGNSLPFASVRLHQDRQREKKNLFLLPVHARLSSCTRERKTLVSGSCKA